ncbi:hypothetical protein [Micromonospora sp. NPDC006431]|uniref:hypothetical protein n=1 Tax=Micromonospora sp. NPDC006431 TaxID=3364235 RepID=UPI0036A1291F
MRMLTSGLIAGAAGTAALDLVTYLDIAVRRRPPSSTPEQSVRRLASLAGVKPGDDPPTKHRITGLGALLGYSAGLGAAACYARLNRHRLPRPAAALVLTALAMAGSNTPMTMLGITDPRRWSATDWASDLIPHLADGAVAVATYRGLCHRDRGRRR